MYPPPSTMIANADAEPAATPYIVANSKRGLSVVFVKQVIPVEPKHNGNGYQITNEVDDPINVKETFHSPIC